MDWLEVVRNFFLALAFTVVLFLCGVYVPLAGIFFLALAPHPVLVFGTKYGIRSGLGLLSLAPALLFLIGGRDLALGYALLALMIALLFFSFGRGWSIESVVARTGGAMLATVTLGLAAFFGSFFDLRAGLRDALKEKLEISLQVYGKIGLSGEGIEVLRERAPQIIDFVLQILPALAFSGFAALVLLNLFFLYRRFPEYRDFFFAGDDLREWKSPEPIIWCFIVSGFALFLPGWQVVKVLAWNLFAASVFLYFLQGLAIISYYFHHKNVPHFLRGLAYVLIILEQLFTVFVVGLGLFDLWGDFRRLKKKNLNPSRAS